MQRYLWMLLALPVIWAQVLLEGPANCVQPAKPGPCLAGITNYFYNTTSGQCETFTFGGCGGNDNRFQSKEDCERRCSCHMPPGPGPCKASMERWYYNEKKGCCERFVFGGCRPNGNNFESKRACEQTCNWSFSGKQKPLGIEWGSGYDRKLGEIVYKNYGTTFGGSGTIWLHNEIESMKSTPAVGSQIMGIIKRTGRRQVPGVQTKQHYKIMMGGQGGGQGQSGGGMVSGGSGGIMMSGLGGDDMMRSGGSGGMMSSGGSGGMMSSGGSGGMMSSGGSGGMMSSGGSGGMMRSGGGGGGMMSSGGSGGMMSSGGGGGGMMRSGAGGGGMMSSGGNGGMMSSGGSGGMMSSRGSGGMMSSGGNGGMMSSGGRGGMMRSGGRMQTGGGQGAGLGPGITNIVV